MKRELVAITIELPKAFADYWQNIAENLNRTRKKVIEKVVKDATPLPPEDL